MSCVIHIGSFLILFGSKRYHQRFYGEDIKLTKDLKGNIDIDVYNVKEDPRDIFEKIYYGSYKIYEDAVDMAEYIERRYDHRNVLKYLVYGVGIGSLSGILINKYRQNNKS